MSTRFRQPFAFELDYEEHHKRLAKVEAALPRVALPVWAFVDAVEGTQGGHKNARYAMDNITRRHMDQARERGCTEYTYDQAEAEGRRAAYRHDDK